VKPGVTFVVKVTPNVVDAAKAPEVPATVTVADPEAVLGAVSVRTQLPSPVMGVVQPEAVTPLGRPETASVTLPVNPPVSVTVMVSAPVPLWSIDRFAGEAESVKPPVFDGPMVSAIVVVAGVNAPEVPVMVIVEFPRVAEALAAKVSTLDPVVGFVANVAVTPLGNPDAARVTLPVNPPASTTLIVSVPLLP